MDAPPMPQLTPEQLQIASAYLPVEQVMMAAAYLPPNLLEYQINNIKDDRGPEIIATGVVVGLLALVAVVTFYAYQFFWATAMALIKLSILLFYRRLFPRENTTARWRISHLTLCIASVALAIISIFGTAFQCTPVAYLWDLTIPGGHCMNFSAFARFTNIANMTTDILILVMPMPIVWSLHLDRQRKIAVSALFLLGGFVCVASILRFYYLEHVDTVSDPTWDNVDTLLWTTIEPCIGVVCACLPIMGPLLRTHIASLSSSIFRSRKHSNNSSFPGNPSHGTAPIGSRDRRSFGRIGGGARDEEMGIPLKEPGVLAMRDVSTSGS
ncbi:MAG: hypothetical protein Q9169_004431 [Polycauliona sp. 2 TL-2023]